MGGFIVVWVDECIRIGAYIHDRCVDGWVDGYIVSARYWR